METETPMGWRNLSVPWKVVVVLTETNQLFPGGNDSALWIRSERGSFIKAVCHYLLFHAALLFARSLRCVSQAGVNDIENSKSPSVSASHLILSGTLWVWLPSLWQLPAYCDRLVAPWSLRRAIAPWVSTETPLAMRLQD